MKKFVFISLALLLLAACSTSLQPLPPQEIKLKIEGVDAVKVSEATDQIMRSMDIPNTDLELSNFTRIHGDTAYMKWTSVNSYVSEGTWEDLKFLAANGIKKTIVYMNNPGGSSWDGKALADMMMGLSEKDMHITVEGYGIIASAAVLPYLVADHRVAFKNTIFLIHPSSLFKFITRETEKDIESQRKMFELGRNQYADIVEAHSNLDRETIMELLSKDSWFSAEKAKEWGMVDTLR
jgi:ATP-dependent protease ClpP protease subunit